MGTATGTGRWSRHPARSRIVQVHGEAFLDVEAACNPDQGLGEVGIDAPVAHLVGIGQGIARDPTVDPHVVELPALGAKASLDIPQALAVGELCECHAEELIETSKRLDLAVAVVAPHALAEGVQRHVLDDLGEDEFACVHAPLTSTRKFVGEAAAVAHRSSSR